MKYPDGETIEGHWDLRGLFAGYIGNYPLQGKTVLDVGTAGGFLAFEAERAGASVTAMDALGSAEFDRLHFRGSQFHYRRRRHIQAVDSGYTSIKAGFWYSWHKFDSNVEVIYAPLSRLPYWRRRFDVVIAGAILEHLADPVTTIGILAALADEALILAFTPVVDSPEQFMQTATEWNDPANDYTFWILSRGLYERIFENLGFSLEFVPAVGRWNGVDHARPTIIARRQHSRRTPIDKHT